MSINAVKVVISTFCLIVSLFYNTIHGMEENEKYQLAKELELCSTHSYRLVPSLFGSFDEPEARSKLCHVCKDINNIKSDTGSEIQDAYSKYMKQLYKQGHITQLDLLDIEKEIIEYKLKYPITHFQK